MKCSLINCCFPSLAACLVIRLFTTGMWNKNHTRAISFSSHVDLDSFAYSVGVDLAARVDKHSLLDTEIAITYHNYPAYTGSK